ncbi:PIN domain-containing protein [Streptomyces bluensis]|uniref:PIN domain-containing protein n=1 Tax=Streptomyces bluensis TaxID=33897 RepID=UPI0033348F42
MIVLDSNQLRLFLPGSPALRLFSAVAKQAGHTIATTDIAVREVMRQRRRDLSAALKALAEAERELNALVIKSEHRTRAVPRKVGLRGKSAFIEPEIRELETAIPQAYQVLETAPEDALEAIQREADHQPPCRDGSGARDAAIWLTAARACQHPDTDGSGRPLPVIFISKDKDFTEPGDPRRPAEALRSDVPKGGRVILKSEVLDAMSELGYPRRRADADEVTGRPTFHQALVNVVMAAATYDESPLTVPDGAEVAIRAVDSTRAFECQGNGIRLTSISGEWSFRLVTERLPRRPNGLSGGYRGFTAWVEGVALLVEDKEHGALDAEFLPHTVSFGPSSPRKYLVKAPVPSPE